MLPGYSAKINEIKTDLKSMGELAVESLTLSLDGLKKGDASIIEGAAGTRIKHINYLANSIDNNVVVALALYSPEAGELRELIAILKSTNEMLRIGTSARSYATGLKSVLESPIDLSPFMNVIIDLHQTAIRSVTLITKGIETFDADTYRSILVEEDKSDELATFLQEEILEKLCDNKELVSGYVKMLRRIRKLEKIVDYAQNIGKMLMYAKEGGKVEFN